MQASMQLRGNSAILTLVLALTVAILIVMAFHAPAFFRVNNLVNVLVQTSVLGLLAVGMCFVLVGGGIDLSMPSVLAFSGILGVIYMRETQDALLGPLIILAAGGLLGAFNGAAVAYFRMAPFVVTLATMTVVGGANVWLTGSQSVFGYPAVFENVVLARFLGLPLSVWVFLLGTALATAVMSASPFGRQVKAVGFNPKAAEIARVRVPRVIFATYVVSGVLAALTGILLVARLGSASANLGSDSLLLDIISACVIGRVSIYGGVGSPLHAALGALFVTLISNSLNQLGVSYFASLIIKGCIIIVFVYLDKAIRRQA
ncbi:ABC transporter permease [Mesorhizobium sp. AaZ16]|uniref:ABC transporter permease n=1 Tax=Mesorhizobium sp. AaZ16 TaxID=3402289 RepID=UPI00374F9146